MSPCVRPLKMFDLCVFFFAFVLSRSHAVPNGSLKLYSTPDCRDLLHINDSILGADICLTSVTASSYTISRRPSCTNGSFAMLTEYSDSKCSTALQMHPYESYGDGSCEGNIRFDGIAFICNGFADLDPGDASQAKNGLDGAQDDKSDDGYTNVEDSADTTPLNVTTSSAPSAFEESSAVPFPTPKVPIPVSSDGSAALSRASDSAAAASMSSSSTGSSSSAVTSTSTSFEISTPSSASGMFSTTQIRAAITSASSIAPATKSASSGAPAIASAASSSATAASASWRLGHFSRGWILICVLLLHLQ